MLLLLSSPSDDADADDAVEFDLFNHWIGRATVPSARRPKFAFCRREELLSSENALKALAGSWKCIAISCKCLETS